MKISYFEKGFNYSQDGPGNRLVYHLCGCNMHCPWCSNPEGIEVLTEYEHTASVNEIAKEIFSCKPMFFDGGGVTFTGGECTLQAPALVELITQLRRMGINCAIESNASTEGFFDVARQCDYIMVDYKNPFSDPLKQITGEPNEKINENFEKILQYKFIHIRIPFINGFNNSEETIKAFCEFFEHLNSVARFGFDVEILPYHEYGKEKWAKLGLQYNMKDAYVDKKQVEYFRDLLISKNIKIANT